MKSHLLPILAILSIFQSGCSTLTFPEALATGVGAGAGTVIGGAIDDSPESRAAGAVIGGIAGLATERHLSKKRDEVLQEAYERGRREATVEAMEQLWDARINPQMPLSSIEAKSVSEKSGIYDSISYLERPTQRNPYDLFDPVR